MRIRRVKVNQPAHGPQTALPNGKVDPIGCDLGFLPGNARRRTGLLRGIGLFLAAEQGQKNGQHSD
jgi:hypothetical protein